MKPLRLENIYIKPSKELSTAFEIHDTIPVETCVTYSDGTSYAFPSNKLAYFSFEPTGICKVNEDGEIVAVKGGETTITSHYGEFTASVKVKVNPAKPTGITLNSDSVGVLFGVPQKLNVFYEMSDGTQEKVGAGKVKVEAESLGIVSFNPVSGEIFGTKQGETSAKIIVDEFETKISFTVPRYPEAIRILMQGADALRKEVSYYPEVQVLYSDDEWERLDPRRYQIEFSADNIKRTFKGGFVPTHFGKNRMTVKFLDKLTGILHSDSKDLTVLPNPVRLSISSEDDFSSPPTFGESRITGTLEYEDGSKRELGPFEYKLSWQGDGGYRIKTLEDAHYIQYLKRPATARAVEVSWLTAEYADRVSDSLGRIVQERVLNDTKRVTMQTARETADTETPTEKSEVAVVKRKGRNVKRVKSLAERK